MTRLLRVLHESSQVVAVVVSRRKAINYMVAILTLLVFLATVNSPPLFHHNQNQYFSYGLYLAGWPGLQNDFNSQVKPVHIVFTWLVAGLERLGLLEMGVEVLSLVLYSCLLLAAWLLILAVHDTPRAPGNTPAQASELHALALLSLGVFVFLLNASPVARLDAWLPGLDLSSLATGYRSILHGLSGMANQYIFGRYLQPSEFGILILLGVATAHYRRWVLTSALLGVASLMHISYVMHTGIMMAIITIWLLRRGDWRSAVRPAIVYALLTAPAVVYALLLNYGDPNVSEGYRIYAYERSPHHTLPGVWWSKWEAIRLAIMVAATLVLMLRQRGVVAWLALIGVVYTVVGIVLVVVTGSPFLALQYPWRGTAVYVPLGIITLTAAATEACLQLASRIHHRLWYAFRVGHIVLLAAAFAVLVPPSIAQTVHPKDPAESVDEVERFARLVGQHTSPTDTIIIPVDTFQWERFRLVADRPAYVDWKTPPAVGSEIVEWWNRVQTVRRFYQSEDEVRLDICDRHGITHYVELTANRHPTQKVVVGTESFVLISC